jgi:hypothetical protein
MNAHVARPWYREPMLWLTIAIPLLTIPAGLATWYLAARGGSSDAVGDEVRRMGQMQIADVRPDSEAARLGLSARAQIQADRTRVEVLLSDAADAGALTLELRHSGEATRDQVVRLESLGGGRFAAQVDALGSGAWNARLVSSAGWRLSGRLEAGDAAFALGPAVGAG